MLGLSRADGVAGEVLRDLGVTSAALMPILDDIYASDHASPRPETDEFGRPWHVRATPAAEHARGRAEGIATGLGERQGRVHLLLALAYDRDGFHSSILKRLGLSRSSIVEALKERGVVVPANAPARDPDPTTQAVVLPDAHARIVVAELGLRSIADRATYFDEEGRGRWGYGGVSERPEHARVTAQASIDLRGIVRAALEDAGLPQPTEEDWETFTPFDLESGDVTG